MNASTILPRLVLLAFILSMGTACRNTKKDTFDLPGQTDLVIKRFTIKGVTKVPLAELKGGLATRKSRWTAAKSVKWVPLLGSEKQFFNYVHWQQDVERIRTFYYARGYFDAKIVSENVSERPDKKEVRIAITISEGTPTTVSDIVVEGVDGKKSQAELVSNISVKRGEVFTQAKYLESRQLLRQQLERAGYAYAQVEGRVVIDARKHQAQVVFYVDAGPLSQFGPVTIVGMDAVPESSIREAVTFEGGDQFTPEKMQETQERIYDLGVFSIVKVSAQTERAEEDLAAAEPVPGLPSPVDGSPAEEEELDLDDLGGLMEEAQAQATARAMLDPAVPVTIQVKEAKLWNLRVGAGVAAEVARQEAHGRLDWSSRNFLGGLRKLEQFNSAGYAWAPSVLSTPEERNEGVIVDSELRFTQPRFIERFTTFESRLRFQREVAPGFNLISPTAKLALRRRFLRVLTVEVSYNFALFVLTGIEPALLDPLLQLQPEYILEYLEQKVAIDFRNDFLNPTRGILIEAQLQEATQYLGRIPGVPTTGEFDYLAPTLSIETYWPIWRHVLAIRARGATIYSLGGAQPPVPQRLYAGGSDSMRAFGQQRLSLYSVSGEALPIGGFTKFEASVEPRLRLIRDLAGVGDFWMAPFFDAATVLPGAFLFQTGQAGAAPESIQSISTSLLYGVGLGAWWVTPIGPVRLDFAYRLSDINEDARFRRCAIEPTIAGTCNGGFIAEASDPVRERVKSPFNVILGIGHSF